eukprot:1148707-Pelagomonas_calceolata.AAC.7
MSAEETLPTSFKEKKEPWLKKRKTTQAVEKLHTSIKEKRISRAEHRVSPSPKMKRKDYASQKAACIKERFPN